MTRIVAAIFVVSAAMVLAPPAARADDHRWPNVYLRVGEQRQQGFIHHVDWIRPRDCIGVGVWGPPGVPKALRYRPGDVATVVLAKDEIPGDLRITGYREVDRYGQPRGEGEPVPFTIMPRVRDGRVVAWTLRFVAPPFDRHYYPFVEATWEDEDRCAPHDVGPQYGSWRLHLRSRA